MKNHYLITFFKINRLILNMLNSGAFLLIAWFFSSLYIIYLGFKPYRVFAKEELQTNYPINGVILTLVLSSIYYVYAFFNKIFLAQHVATYSQYLSKSCIIIFLLYMICMGAMHSPPYWYRLFINLAVLSICHFIVYPILFFIDKFMGAKYLA
ncbi:hypothetical protein [Acinetobacter ihumii]|uniref:hypothetical protein n=1 Tax=Acinetobacter ihumii TaxID=2483802 RepID=UPI0010318884|nr:hypothetical protein [Acinetobacter ihumii]